MNYILSPHGTEEYKCIPCGKHFQSKENINQTTWKCEECNTPIRFKVCFKDWDHAGYRLTPSEIRVDELITLDRKYIHRVLDVKFHNGKYRIALEGNGVKYFDSDFFLLLIDGSWE